VKGNLVRDVNALAGRELLPWDCWGAVLEPKAGLVEEALSALDEVARATPMRASLTARDAEGWAGRAGFRLPRRIVSFHTGRPEEIDLGPILDG